jgi:hypothetical protein
LRRQARLSRKGDMAWRSPFRNRKKLSRMPENSFPTRQAGEQRI